jgi:hypothetical protein
MISACLPRIRAPVTAYEVSGPKRQLTGWSFGEARKTLEVGVSVTVGSSNSTKVSTGAGVRVERLDVGVSSTGVRVDAGVSVV